MGATYSNRAQSQDNEYGKVSLLKESQEDNEVARNDRRKDKKSDYEQQWTCLLGIRLRALQSNSSIF
jgi:hypothetical protein